MISSMLGSFNEYLFRAIVSLTSSSNASDYCIPTFTASQLVLQIREEGYKGLIFPDSVNKGIAALFNKGIVSVNSESNRYGLSKSAYVYIYPIKEVS